ncbi:MAG: diaminopimelate epimerase [Nitrospirae bacterium]|nr:diaminopimelate epimerase [Nitrospirota bacterium]
MKLKFTKMHGLGNDFILIDAIAQKGLPQLSSFCKEYSDRRFGIGFDQALILYPSTKADFRMEIFNADGSQVEMCGNGIRCFAKYIWDRGLSDKEELAVETLGGIIKPEKAGDLVRVDMGEPILDGPAIPVNLEGRIKGYPLSIEDREFRMSCVSMGNPHAVIFMDNVKSFPVTKYGPFIENHTLFPKRTNVEVVEVINKEEVRMRAWERGSGETLACGTGACASAVASYLNGFTGREVTVHLAGGDLKIEWSEKDNHVYMTGPAVEVFSGEVSIVSR